MVGWLIHVLIQDSPVRRRPYNNAYDYVCCVYCTVIIIIEEHITMLGILVEDMIL